MNELVIGVDAGGTHTRAALANLRGEILGAGDAGSGNPHQNGPTAARSEILSAIQRAFDAAHIEQQNIAAACLGIAGIDREDERVEWTKWASEKLSVRPRIVNDGELVLAAGSAENWGVALVAGTGSIAWGKSRDGRAARAGGWGHAIGDEGSAYDLARQALRAASQYADGRGEKTRLLDAILAYWKLESPQDLIGVVYRSEKKPADIAELAAVVVQCAEANDPVSQSLIENGSTELATMIYAVAHALEIQNDKFPLALAGGLLLGAETVRVHLLQAAEKRGLKFSSVALVNEPIKGAVRMAVEMMKSSLLPC